MSTPAPRPALPASGDLRALARELHRIHEASFSGSRMPQRPRAVVARSWERMRALPLAPDGNNQRLALDAGALDQRRANSALAPAMASLRASLGPVAASSPFLVVISDADGVLLWREGPTGVLRQADRLGFTTGSTWTEDLVGTNAIGTALAEQAPVQLFSAEHFEATQHPWYCSAAPVHHPATGELLGIVDVSGPAMTLHPAIGALVRTAVQLAEHQLAADHRHALHRLARSWSAATHTTRGPWLLIDEHGWVADAQGLMPPERVPVPHGDAPIRVPGLGLSVAEPIPGGWLLSPRVADGPLRGRLDPHARLLSLVGGRDEPWVVELSERHAQVLSALVAAGPAGLTAAQLSHAIFGDTTHQVSVRAEISRLRKSVGALLATGPYRVAPGVHLDVIG